MKLKHTKNEIFCPKKEKLKKTHKTHCCFNKFSLGARNSMIWINRSLVSKPIEDRIGKLALMT